MRQLAVVYCCTILFSAWFLRRADTAKTEADEISFSIEEQCANFTRVGDLAQRQQLLRRLQTLGINPSTCSYSWIQKKHPLTSKLFLDERTGSIYTIDTIDREEYLACSGVGSVCCSSATIVCSIPLSVGVQCGGHQMVIVNVKLEINDKNDHTPQFPTSNFTIEIPESAEIGSKYYFPAASDPDSNPYSIDSYELLPRGGARLAGRDLFEVKAAANRVQLTLKRRLDRELNERYDFEVRATDRQAKAGSMNLTVHISDVNDHPPVFTAPNKLYNVTVAEDFRVGDTILQIHATDSDVGDNAQVTYEFHETASQYVRDRLSLDEESGNLTLRSELDFESMSRIEFYVVAKNRATFPSRFDEAAVMISVQNVNDESPVIEVEYRNELVDDRTSGETSENLPNTFVAFIFVSDRDSFGDVNCTLSNDRFRLEKFYRQPTSTDFRLNATRSFDRETNALETVTITCTDRGQPPRSSSQLIRIHVKDANDQAPTFTESPIRCNLTENNHVGVPICQISDFVRDLDEGENSLIKYTIEKSARFNFRIEEFSGQLSAITTFDRENRSSYQFLVFATDQGKPPLSATGTVIVTIADANDNPPRFSYSLPSLFSVQEERPFNEYVGTVRAIDPDAELNARIVYSLEPMRNSPFRITESGEIFTTQKLDREAEDTYQLVVFATDSGIPPQSSSTTVTITVSGINDCNPNISFPSSNNNTVRISYLEQPNRQITAIVATDSDAPESRLTYSIIEGNERGLFFIDPMNGVIHIAKPLTDALGDHTIRVRVEDNGSPNLHSDERLRIIVDNSAPAYDFAHVQNQPQFIGGYTVSTMHLIIIAALACAIVLVLLAACAIIIRRRLVLHHSVFSPPTHQKRKTRKQPNRFANFVDRLLQRNEAPTKVKAKSMPNVHTRGSSRSAHSRAHSSNSAHAARDKLGTLQKPTRDRKDVTNQEDLEVQAAFLQLAESQHSAVNGGDEGQIYATVDTESGAYEEGLYNGAHHDNGNKNEMQPLHTVSEHVCSRGQQGTLVPYAATGTMQPMTVVPVTPTIIDPASYFRTFAPNGRPDPAADQPYFNPEAHNAHVHAPNAVAQSVYAPSMYGDLHTRSFSQPRFNAVGAQSATANIPMHRLYQDQTGHFRAYPPRPHTAMRAVQSDSFSSVAVTVATPEPTMQGCTTATGNWVAGQNDPNYFQYDECNNVAPITHFASKTDRRRKRTPHGEEQYCTIDRVPSQPSDSEVPRVYGGIVKGSFV